MEWLKHKIKAIKINESITANDLKGKDSSKQDCEESETYLISTTKLGFTWKLFNDAHSSNDKVKL